MEEVQRYLDHTYFAWIGGTEPTSVFYYRIQSPVMLIEFDHQLPVGLRHLASEPALKGALAFRPRLSLACRRLRALAVNMNKAGGTIDGD